MPSLSERAQDIMGSCVVFGVPGDRETAYALSELSAALHDELDAREANEKFDDI